MANNDITSIADLDITGDVIIKVNLDTKEAEKSVEEIIRVLTDLRKIGNSISTTIFNVFNLALKDIKKIQTEIVGLTDEIAELVSVTTAKMIPVFETDAESNLFDDVSSAIDSVIQGINTVDSSMGQVEKASATILKFVEAIKNSSGSIGAVLTALLPKTVGVFQAVGGALIPIGEAIMGALGGIATALGISVGWVIAIIAAVIAAIVAVVVYWDEIKLFFTETLPQLWNQFVEWVSGIGAAAAELFSSAMSAISGFFTDCWNGIVEIWSGIGEWMQSNVIQPILDFFTPIVQWFAELFGSIWQTVSDVFYNIGVIITGCWEIIQTAWSIAAQWFDTNIIQPVAGFFVGLWTSISTWAIDAWNAIAEVFIGIGSWIDSNIIQPVSEFFSGLWNGFLSAAEDAWEGVKSVFNTVAEFFGNIFSDAWEGVVKVFSAAGEIFTDIKEGILTAFTSIVNGLITGINSAIAIPFKGINTAIDVIRNIKIFDISPFSGLKTINVPQIPYLAQGAVLPANRPFLAVVGDQRHGTNVEAPLTTIQEAVAVVLSQQLPALMAGFEAVVNEQRATRKMIAEIRIGDDMIANAVHRYDRKIAVMRGL